MIRVIFVVRRKVEKAYPELCCGYAGICLPHCNGDVVWFLCLRYATDGEKQKRSWLSGLVYEGDIGSVRAQIMST